jgi:hypothetical protein
MQPNIILNWPAIIAAMVAAFVFGFLWYGPLFGKIWGKGMGMSMDRKPKKNEMQKALTLQIIGLFLTAYVLAHTLQVWRPSAWGVGQDQPDWVYGFFNGLFVWIGFYVPMQLSKVSWEMRPWKVAAINLGHDFIILQLMSQILAYWK